MSNDYEILNISNYNIYGNSENDRIKKAFNFIKENNKNDELLKEIANEVHMKET